MPLPRDSWTFGLSNQRSVIFQGPSLWGMWDPWRMQTCVHLLWPGFLSPGDPGYDTVKLPLSFGDYLLILNLLYGIWYEYSVSPDPNKFAECTVNLFHTYKILSVCLILMWIFHNRDVIGHSVYSQRIAVNYQIWEALGNFDVVWSEVTLEEDCALGLSSLY